MLHGVQRNPSVIYSCSCLIFSTWHKFLFGEHFCSIRIERVGLQPLNGTGETFGNVPLYKKFREKNVYREANVVVGLRSDEP